ncbi:MAG: sensor histidine kinase [Spirochaetales bacterium]|nr:sensor histidine kinase [Spirochaetales bacterium]
MKRSRPWHTLQGWLLTTNLSMLSIILVLAMIFFGIVFSLLEETQERTRRYEILTTLSTQLNTSRMLFSKIAQNPTHEIDETLLDEFDFMNKELAITLHRLNLGTEEELERYFLHRGVENGIFFINQELMNLIDVRRELDSTEYFNRYWAIDKVYSYLESYTFYRYLPKAVKSDVWSFYQTRQLIFTYRSIGVLLFLFIVTIFSSLFYKLTMRLVTPVQSMVDAAKQIFHGNFDGEPIPISGPLELQYLEESMNQMRQSLKERMEILEENAELEKRLHEQELERMRTKRELEKARYNALQSQINPHFLFNTLNTISRTALFENAPSTVDLIDNLAAIFRYTLKHNEDVTLAEEMQFIREYLTIQQYRFKERLSFSILLSEELKDMRIPPLVLQPLVENSMIHGLEPKVEGGMIALEAKKNGKKAMITITDSGVGIDMNKLYSPSKASSHIGIRNIERRIDHYFNGKSTMKFERMSDEGGTQVTLLLPIHYGDD